MQFRVIEPVDYLFHAASADATLAALAESAVAGVSPRAQLTMF